MSLLGSAQSAYWWYGTVFDTSLPQVLRLRNDYEMWSYEVLDWYITEFFRLLMMGKNNKILLTSIHEGLLSLNLTA